MSFWDLASSFCWFLIPGKIPHYALYLSETMIISTVQAPRLLLLDQNFDYIHCSGT